MKKTVPFIRVALLTLPFALLLFYGCDKEGESADSIVHLNFDHTVGGEELQLNDTWYPGAAGHPFQVGRLKYYTSNFALENAGSGRFELHEVHYRDIENPETRTLEWRGVLPGEYNGISFIFGLDEAANVNGGLPNTTTNINMEWPLPGDQGYHYMKFEGRYNRQGSGDIKPFNLHTGATGNNQNYVRVILPFHHPVKMSGGAWQICLNMDLNEWLQNPHIYDFETFGPMIMANQNAQQLLKENGASVFSLSTVEKE